ncbi:MAG TPA: hypothetical protein VFH08_08205 [Chitinophagaceae bacterium]|nr:hypothetical protein [Chitinophagaceae bacterium]
MQIIKTILQTEIFESRPPVLVDIGASGEINPKWRPIAPYSICVAFDADDREFNVSEQTNKTYKKLITFNRIVTDKPVEKANFFLTRSPFCSSQLEPDIENLQPWIFSSLFETEKKVELPAITLQRALSQIRINYIDWFKTDTQGTDLRLFKTLPTDISTHILAAEFEPGIIDAYVGEDKIYEVMEYMRRDKFWLSSLVPKGVQRLNATYERNLGAFVTGKIVRKSPCWAEVTYLRQPFLTDQRQILLLYIFALLEKQYGFALELADIGSRNFQDKIFPECKKAVLKKLRVEKWKIPFVILKRQFNKLFASIND